jgi:pimeloyl-ACP methyl ester carboxylesterase
MKHSLVLTWLLIAAAFLSTACKKDDDGNKDLGPEAEMMPIVMAHGFLASGDTYELQFLRFASNGYPMDMLYTYEWNTLAARDNANEMLDKFIDEVLEKTGMSQVDLGGHSAGSFLVYDYCSNPTRAAKVRNVVLLAGNVQPGPAGPVGAKIPTLNIYSPFDRIVAGGGNIEGATNLRIPQKDHYEVATCKEAFEAMYKFFRNRPPQTLDVIEQNNPSISGKVLSFGENLPGEGATLEIYEVSSENGARLRSTPDFTFTVNERNEWGPFQAKTGSYYEFRVSTGASGDRPVHYYREPFKRDNKTVIIRSFPPSGSFASVFLGALPSNNNQAVNAFFGSSQACIVNRDALNVQGIELSNFRYASATNTTIAMFMYDANNNGRTDDTPIGAFQAFPFLVGVDFFFPTAEGEFTTFNFNGRKLHVKNWPSADEGVSVAVFD